MDFLTPSDGLFLVSAIALAICSLIFARRLKGSIEIGRYGRPRFSDDFLLGDLPKRPESEAILRSAACLVACGGSSFSTWALTLDLAVATGTATPMAAILSVIAGASAGAIPSLIRSLCCLVVHGTRQQQL